MPGLSSKLRPMLLVALTLAVLAPGGAKAFAAQGPSATALRVAGAAEIQDVYVRAPENIPHGELLQVLIVLHGMGGNGPAFASAFTNLVDTQGWLIVAPTITYGDWTNPDQIAREDPALVAWLSDYVRHLSQRTGYSVEPRVLLFGHSRGAQLALRFTEIHPEAVVGVAAASAGTYTLPFSRDRHTGKELAFPFGVANLAQTDGGQAFDARSFESVPIWIGVGAADTNDADVPDAWDQYIGPDRLDRALAFTQALQTLGADGKLHVFPNTGHALTDAMRAAACSHLAAAVASDQSEPEASAT